MAQNPIWGPPAEKVVEVANTVIDDSIDDLVLQAEEQPDTLVELTQEQKDQINQVVFEEIDQTRESTVDSLIVEGESDEISNALVDAAKVVAAVSILEQLRTSMSKIKLSQQWVQVDDKDAELQKQVDTAKNENTFIVNSEFSSHYHDMAVDQLDGLGEDSYIWIHVTEVNGRPEHIARDGQEYEIGTPEGDEVGDAHGCNCVMGRIE